MQHRRYGLLRRPHHTRLPLATLWQGGASLHLPPILRHGARPLPHISLPRRAGDHSPATTSTTHRACQQTGPYCVIMPAVPSPDRHIDLVRRPSRRCLKNEKRADLCQYTLLSAGIRGPSGGHGQAIGVRSGRDGHPVGTRTGPRIRATTQALRRRRTATRPRWPYDKAEMGMRRGPHRTLTRASSHHDQALIAPSSRPHRHRHARKAPQGELRLVCMCR